MKNNLKINSQVITGFAIGAIVPVLGYVLVQLIFDQLTNSGIMSELSNSLSVIKRQRTLAVIGIACNLIPFQFLKSRRGYDTMRGVVVATIVYAVIWIVFFWDSIIQ